MVAEKADCAPVLETRPDKRPKGPGRGVGASAGGMGWGSGDTGLRGARLVYRAGGRLPVRGLWRVSGCGRAGPPSRGPGPSRYRRMRPGGHAACAWAVSAGGGLETRAASASGWVPPGVGRRLRGGVFVVVAVAHRDETGGHKDGQKRRSEHQRVHEGHQGLPERRQDWVEVFFSWRRAERQGRRTMARKAEAMTKSCMGRLSVSAADPCVVASDLRATPVSRRGGAANIPRAARAGRRRGDGGMTRLCERSNEAGCREGKARAGDQGWRG